MRNRSIKYIASVFLLISVCYVNPLAAQEGGFMFHEGGGDSYQEKPEAPSSPGTENTYTQPGLKSNYSKDKKKTEAQEQQEQNDVQKPVAETHSPTKPASNPSTNSTTKDEDSDSVLSFNFLHYIIQRFKFSDVIEE